MVFNIDTGITFYSLYEGKEKGILFNDGTFLIMISSHGTIFHTRNLPRKYKHINSKNIIFKYKKSEDVELYSNSDKYVIVHKCKMYLSVIYIYKHFNSISSNVKSWHSNENARRDLDIYLKEGGFGEIEKLSLIFKNSHKS